MYEVNLIDMQLFASLEEIISLLIITMFGVAGILQARHKRKFKKARKVVEQKGGAIAKRQSISAVASSDVADFGNDIVEISPEYNPVIETISSDTAKADSISVQEDDKYWFDLRQAVIYSEILNRKY